MPKCNVLSENLKTGQGEIRLATLTNLYKCAIEKQSEKRQGEKKNTNYKNLCLTQMFIRPQTCIIYENMYNI